jgi:hypothetical protein
MCWFGSKMSKNREDAFNSLKSNIGVPYMFINNDNVYQYQHKKYPYHKAFKYLSGNHKSDYLRSYLLHHYGGGYHDIKYRDLSWKNQWNDFKDPNVWIKSRREKYNQIGTMGWVICRPNTKYTKELLNLIHKKLDENYYYLKKNSSKNQNQIFYREQPFSKVNDKKDSYPLRWLEIMGEHFHLLMYKYKKHLIFGLPDASKKKYL